MSNLYQPPLEYNHKESDAYLGIPVPVLHNRSIHMLYGAYTSYGAPQGLWGASLDQLVLWFCLEYWIPRNPREKE